LQAALAPVASRPHAGLSHQRRFGRVVRDSICGSGSMAGLATQLAV
jgi:hypothetical protein